MSQIHFAKHKQFGVSSEKTDSAQLYIFNEAKTTANMAMTEQGLTDEKAHYSKYTRLTMTGLLTICTKYFTAEIIEHLFLDEDHIGFTKFRITRLFVAFDFLKHCEIWFRQVNASRPGFF